MASVKPNEISLVNVLAACARSRDKQVHEYIDQIGIGFQFRTVLTAALMDVYCKGVTTNWPEIYSIRCLKRTCFVGTL